MSENTDLKKCPFCGGKAEDQEYENTSGYWTYYVHCCDCDIKGQETHIHKSKSLPQHNDAAHMARFLWNTRV